MNHIQEISTRCQTLPVVPSDRSILPIVSCDWCTRAATVRNLQNPIGLYFRWRDFIF